MNFALELVKVKRTGFMPAFFGGGILAAAVPALNMAFRSEMYVSMNASPVSILLSANWQMMTMLNILLIVSGACIMYHTEYADNAIQRMCTLPIRENTMFFGKTAVLIAVSIMLLVIEAASILFCDLHWFGQSSDLYLEILQNFGFFLLLMLPAILLSLLIASVCRNMWISLGIGVVCVFLATMIPTQKFVLTLFPFALPFQMLSNHAADVIRNYAIAGAVEMVVIALLEVIILKVRRSFE